MPYLFAADNTLLPWETEAGTLLRFPVPCTQMAVCSVGNEVSLFVVLVYYI